MMVKAVKSKEGSVWPKWHSPHVFRVGMEFKMATKEHQEEAAACLMSCSGTFEVGGPGVYKGGFQLYVRARFSILVEHVGPVKWTCRILTW